ncbi:hypothetical protein GGU11DRAFT_156678 [Lentinula aff. detonsa]|nr:hypothetical protein GGU11DRAFT_156678 [Lentinula aff. detonsa]
MLFYVVLQTFTIVAASLFITAGALPYDVSKPGTFMSPLENPLRAGSSGDSETRVLKSRMDRPSDKEWLAQLNQDWIKYPGKCEGYDQITKFLKTDLTPQVAGREEIIRDGKNNRGIFKLPNRKGYIAKFVDLNSKSSSCEIQALQAFEQDFVPGFTILDNKETVGVITMKFIKGTPLDGIKGWNESTLEQKRLALKNSCAKVGDIVYGFLKAGKPLYADFGPRNLIFQNDGSIHLVDFGHPGIWQIHYLPSRVVFDEWFHNRWFFLWNGYYRNIAMQSGSQSRP